MVCKDCPRREFKNMALIKWQPLLDLEPFRMFEEFDRMFDDFHLLSKNIVPPVDVYEKDDNVIVEVQLPGVNPEKVNINVENGVLTIEGKSEKKTEVEDKNYYRKEIKYGAFLRSISLPSGVDEEKAEAEYDNGVLKVIFPKKQEEKSKKVKIKVKK